jgi:hypothetical protein
LLPTKTGGAFSRCQISFQIGQPDMTKHRLRPRKPENRERQFDELLAAMGMGETADPFARYALIGELEEIERGYARWVQASAKQPGRKLVRQYRAAITKVLELSNEIGPDFFANEIEKAGWSRHNPEADDMTLHRLLEEHGGKPDDVVAALTARVLDIDHWFKTSGENYKKRDVRKLVVEPFLKLMARHGITTSRKQRPRKQIFDALFGWLGVERKFRPSSANVDTIARELEAGAFNSNT